MTHERNSEREKEREKKFLEGLDSANARPFPFKKQTEIGHLDEWMDHQSSNVGLFVKPLSVRRMIDGSHARVS